MSGRRWIAVVLAIGGAGYLVWFATRPPEVVVADLEPEHEAQELEPTLATKEREIPEANVDLPPLDPVALLAEFSSNDFQRQRKAYLLAMTPRPLHYDKPLATWLVAHLKSGGWLTHWGRTLLGKMGADAAEHLRPLFTSDNPHERREALKIASRWKKQGSAPRVNPPLLALLQDGDRHVKNAAWLYAGSGIPYDEEVANHLVSVMEPVNGVGWPGPEIALARMGPKGIARLVALLDDSELVLNALGGLAHAPPSELTKLQDRIAPFIRDEDEEVAVNAIWALAPLEGDSEASIPALAGALGHESVVVLDAALQIFEQMGPRGAKAAPDVLQLLDYDNDKIVTRAAGILGQFKTDPEAVMPALADAAKDDVNEAAAAALGAFGAEAMPHALRAYAEADDDGRYALLLTFRALGPLAKEAVPQLVAAIEGDDAMMQGRAVQALATIGPDAASAIPSIRSQMTAGEIATNTGVRTLMQLGPEGRASVIDLLATKDDKERRDVVMAMSWAYGGTAFALDDLDRIARNDRDTETRRAALQAVYVSMSVPRRPWTNPKADPVLVARVRRILEAYTQDKHKRIRNYAVGALAEMKAKGKN